MEYLLKERLVDDTPEEIGKFLHTCQQIDPQKKRDFLVNRFEQQLRVSTRFFEAYLGFVSPTNDVY